jgi:hypothetical protein
VEIEGTESLGHQSGNEIVNRFGEGNTTQAVTAPTNAKCVEQGGKVISSCFIDSLIFNINASVFLFYSAISPQNVVRACDVIASFISASFKCQ